LLGVLAHEAAGRDEGGMKYLLILILISTFCGSAFAKEECKYGRGFGIQVDAAASYQQCRIANALEDIAEALK